MYEKSEKRKNSLDGNVWKTYNDEVYSIDKEVRER